MNLTQLQSLPKDRVRALFGLEPAALGELLTAVLPPLVEKRYAQQEAKKNRRRAVGGGRRRKLAPYQEVLITLVYLRHNVSHAVCGQMFGVSADISENSFHEVVLLLRDCCPADRWDAEKKWTRREPSWHPDTLDLVLVDSFETPIPRSSVPGVQRKFYSGKKKRHTTKTQIVTDRRGEVLCIEPGHPGPLSDKRLYEASAAAGQYPQAARRADLAYVGVPEMLLPHKRKRGKAKEKAPELTPAQKEENRHAARERVPVEHGVRRVKAVADPAGRVPAGAGPVLNHCSGDGGSGASEPRRAGLKGRKCAWREPGRADGAAVPPGSLGMPLLFYGASNRQTN